MIHFSFGQGKFDTQPTQLTAPDFDAFCEGLAERISSIDVVMEDDDQYEQAKEEINWIAAAFVDGKREKVLAQPRAWLGLDIDQCTHAQFIALKRKLRDYDAFMYTTLGDRRKSPDDRRCRVILNLNRPTEPHEIKHYGPLVAASLFPGPVDMKVWDPNRVFYLTGSHAETQRTRGKVIDLSVYPAAPEPVVTSRPDIELDIDASGVVDWLEQFGAVFVPHLNGYKFENPNPVDYSSPSGLDDFLIQLPKDGNYDMIRVEMLHDTDERKGWRLALEKAGCGALAELIDQHNRDAARAIQAALSVPEGTTVHEWKKKSEQVVEEQLTEYEQERQACGIQQDPEWVADDEGRIYSRNDTPIQHLPKIYNPLRILGLKMAQAKKKAETASQVVEEQEEAAKLEAEQEALEHAPNSYISIMAHHPLAKYAMDVARVTQMPVDTTLLVGLGVLSSICSLAFTVKAHYGQWLPVGLYVLAEQPPGARKSAVLTAFSGTMMAELAMLNRVRRAARAKALEPLDETAKAPTKEQKEYASTLPRPVVSFPMTDATAEALESKTMAPNNGLFCIMTDEKRGIDQMFSSGNQGPKNFAPLLAGYDGGRISSSRVTREGFEGIAHGSVIAFAQDGLISQVLENGNNTGIAERFIFIQESSLLGARKRQSSKERYFNRREYDAFVQFIMLTQLPDVIRLGTDGKGFKGVDLTPHSDLIDDYLYDELEPQIGPGGLYHGGLAGGMAAKQATLIAKLAAILHIYRHGCKGGLVVTEQVTPEGERLHTADQESSTHLGIPEVAGVEDVKIAIELARAILAGNYATMQSLGLAGDNALVNAVIDYLKDMPGYAYPAATAIDKMRHRSPFKKAGRPAKATEMRDLLIAMHKAGTIDADFDGTKLKTIRLKR